MDDEEAAIAGELDDIFDQEDGNEGDDGVAGEDIEMDEDADIDAGNHEENSFGDQQRGAGEFFFSSSECVADVNIRFRTIRSRPSCGAR